jgi:hypothetical protein
MINKIQNVKVCDARSDAIKNKSRVNKKSHCKKNRENKKATWKGGFVSFSFYVRFVDYLVLITLTVLAALPCITRTAYMPAARLLPK